MDGNVIIMSWEMYYAKNRKMDEPDHSFIRATANISGRALIVRQAIYEREVVQKYDEIAALRKEYNALIQAGAIVEPSRVERLRSKANEHPDNRSTQAARKLLEKMGINWEGD